MNYTLILVMLMPVAVCTLIIIWLLKDRGRENRRRTRPSEDWREPEVPSLAVEITMIIAIGILAEAVLVYYMMN